VPTPQLREVNPLMTRHPSAIFVSRSPAMSVVFSGAPVMSTSESEMTDSEINPDEWVACESCDLMVRLPELGEREEAECARCGQVLERSQPDSLRRTLALSIASLMLFVVAQTTVFMSFELDGLVQDAWILTGIQALFLDGKWPLASLILFTAVLAPLLWILSLLYIVVPLHAGKIPPKIASAMRFCTLAKNWSMLEVFLLGVLVTYVKLIGVAKLGIGPGALSFAALMFVTTLAGVSFDARLVWALVWDRSGERS
jgi:paraquat-inducible protein A